MKFRKLKKWLKDFYGDSSAIINWKIYKKRIKDPAYKGLIPYPLHKNKALKGGE